MALLPLPSNLGDSGNGGEWFEPGRERDMLGRAYKKVFLCLDKENTCKMEDNILLLYQFSLVI